MALELPLALQILQAACQHFGYGFRILDTYAKNLVEVSHGKISFVTKAGGGAVYPLNFNTPCQIAKDKAFAYMVLRNHNLSVPEGDYFFLRPEYREFRGEGKEFADAFVYAEKLGYPVFVKPNSASRGEQAEVVYTAVQLRTHLEKIATEHAIVHVQRVLTGNEYRIFVLDGVVQYLYRRACPSITGNGRDSIADLIAAHNTLHNFHEEKAISEASPFLQNELAKREKNMTSVLPMGESLRIAAKTNIDAGGTITDYTETVTPSCAEWAKKVAAVMNLRVCGIDLFSTTDLENPENFTILEVNRNPFLKGIYTAGHQEKALAIWGEILQKYFTEKK